MAELRAFVFSDLAGSVRLKQLMPGASDAERDQAFVRQVLTPHRERIDEFLDIHGGRVVSTAGDGHFLVFPDAVAAAGWAIDLRQSHEDRPVGIVDKTGERPAGVEVRLSMHVGAPQLDPRDPNNFVGRTVDYAARLNDLAAAGQILLSRAAVALLDDAGLDGIRFHAHGRRRLKGIGEVEIFELLVRNASPGVLRAVPDAPTPRHWTVIPPEGHVSQLATGTAVSMPAAMITKIDKYELVRTIGTGGMGDVWLARHPQFDRPRALKVIKPQMVASGGEQVIKRFYREIKAIGALSHPNIVVAIDSSLPEDRTHFLVMEYVDGVSTLDLVARGERLSVANACEIVRQAAVGLQYIHRQGLVHRDIKPSNLMVTIVDDSTLPSSTGPSSAGTPRRGEGRVPLVKILDLGLALLVGDDHDRLTRLDHGAMGTAMYMSPEQWRTTRVDIRSDIYSLGCTLYHLLTGEPPFYHSDLRPQRAHEVAPIPQLPAELGAPPAVQRIIDRTLAKDPADRFQSPGELADALAPWCVGHSLVRVVESVRGPRDDSLTRPHAASDTLVGSSPLSETAYARPTTDLFTSSGGNRWSKLVAIILSLALLTGGVAVAWRYVATAGRTAVLEARAGELDTAAKFAAREVSREIDTRFKLLEQLAQTELVQQQLSQIAASGDDSSLWGPLQAWIEGEALAHSQETPAESWFANSRQGIQVARAPRSDESLGHDYSHRDYFNGREAPVAEGTTGIEPIAEPHQSTVYQSTTTGRLKVAFSVPVGNGEKLATRRQVVGVLAMSVDLGDFEVLENDLRPGLEVVLIDLRNDYVDQQPRRGLILHHNDLPDRKPGEPPPRVSRQLLAEIETLLARPPGEGPRVLGPYADLLGRSNRKYRGVVHPVVISRRGTGERDTRWLVLVQEAVK